MTWVWLFNLLSPSKYSSNFPSLLFQTADTTWKTLKNVVFRMNWLLINVGWRQCLSVLNVNSRNCCFKFSCWLYCAGGCCCSPSAGHPGPWFLQHSWAGCSFADKFQSRMEKEAKYTLHEGPRRRTLSVSVPRILRKGREVYSKAVAFSQLKQQKHSSQNLTWLQNIKK